MSDPVDVTPAAAEPVVEAAPEAAAAAETNEAAPMEDEAAAEGGATAAAEGAEAEKESKPTRIPYNESLASVVQSSGAFGSMKGHSRFHGGKEGGGGGGGGGGGFKGGKGFKGGSKGGKYVGGSVCVVVFVATKG